MAAKERARPRAGIRVLGVGGWLTRRVGLVRCLWAGLGAGLGLAAFRSGVLPLVVVGGVVACLLIAVLVSGRLRRTDLGPLLAVVLALVLGLFIGGVRIGQLSESALAAFVGRSVTVEVMLEEALQQKGRWLSGPARVTSLSGRAFDGGGVWVQLKTPSNGSGEGGREATPSGPAWGRGDIVRMTGRLELPVHADSGFDQLTYLQRKGIAVTLSGDVGRARVVGHRGGLAGLIDRLRVGMCTALEAGIPATHSSILQGILLGLKDGIPGDVMDEFRRAGLSHLLTVSGSHVAWLLVLMSALGRGLRLPRAVSLSVSVAALAIFVPLTDGSPSVLRAGVAGALMVACQLAGRRRDSWQLVFMAASLLLISNPFLVMAPGFQLSFAAVAGILLWSAPLARKLSRLPRFIAEAASVTLAASMATFPISLLQFDQAPLGSLPANLAVGPVVPLVTGLALLGAFAGLLGSWCPIIFNVPAAVLVEWTCRVASVTSRIPVLGRGAIGPLAAGACAAAIGRMLVRRRAAGRPAPPNQLGLLVPIVAGLIGALLFFPAAQLYEIAGLWRARSEWPQEGELRILDVGQGSATLVRTPNRHAVLIDAGPPGQGLVEQLGRLGVNRLDLLVISHPHLDHFGGCQDLEGRVRAEMVVDPVGVSGGSESEMSSGSAEMPAYLEARASLVSSNAVRHPANGTEFSLDGVGFRFLTACSDEGRAVSGDSNSLSLVVEVRLNGIAILVPGDAEAQPLESMNLKAVDILAVSHHGSKGALSAKLLEQLGFRMAAISVGQGNSFGHPHEETLSRLEEAGVAVFRTDRSGWVAVRPGSDGPEIRLQRMNPEEGDKW